MQLVTVRLDRVFDIVDGAHQRKNVTFFGFDYGQVRVFGAHGPGRPDLQAGAVLSAYLRKENDWTTVVGWYNHTTGETVLESGGYEVSFIGITALAAVALLSNGLSVPAGVWLFLAGMGGWSCWCIRSLRQLHYVAAELVRVKAAPTPALAAGSSAAPPRASADLPVN